VSKVVKGIGRAVSKVVKGVTNVVKKVAKSKLGKVLLTAAAVYFGGAALMGGLNTIGTSTSFLSGMGSGLSSAATGIGNAFTALTKGSFSGAGTALSEGFMGTAGSSAPAALATPAATPGMSMAPQSIVSPAQAAITQATGGAPMSMAAPAGMTPAAAGASKGFIASAMASPYFAPAVVTSGAQLGGGLIQGVGMQKAQNDQAKQTAQQKADWNSNIANFRYA
jgi:hypothetical protein